MKKIINLLLIFFISIMLFGCSLFKEKGLNSERGTEYNIDFVDFIDIKLYGSEGYGFIEIKPKEFSLADFNSEDLYIRVKKIIDSLDLRINSNPNSISSYLMVSPNQNLKNGDIISLSIREDWVNPDSQLTVNIEPYLIQINGLEEGKVIDLFNDSSVLFYGLNNSNEVYAYKRSNGSIPSDVLDKLEYDVKTDDNNLEANKTVISINVSMDEDKLAEGDDPAFTMDTYLGRQGYIAEMNKEKVLTKIITPINNETIDEEKMMKALLEFLNSNEIIVSNELSTLESINTVQQNIDSNNIKNQFTYLVTFYVSSGGDRQCMATKLKIAEIDNEYVVIDKVESITKTNDKYCSIASSGYTVIADYNIPEEQENDSEENVDESIDETIDKDGEEVQ